MGKIIKVELTGRDVWFSERTARQVMAFTEFATTEDDDEQQGDQVPGYMKAVYANAYIINDSARAFNRKTHKLNFYRRWRQLRLTNRHRLIRELSPKELGDLALRILVDCEGLNPQDDRIQIKKKTSGSQLVQKSPPV